MDFLWISYGFPLVSTIPSHGEPTKIALVQSPSAGMEGPWTTKPTEWVRSLKGWWKLGAFRFPGALHGQIWNPHSWMVTNSWKIPAKSGWWWWLVATKWLHRGCLLWNGQNLWFHDRFHTPKWRCYTPVVTMGCNTLNDPKWCQDLDDFGQIFREPPSIKSIVRRIQKNIGHKTQNLLRAIAIWHDICETMKYFMKSYEI